MLTHYPQQCWLDEQLTEVLEYVVEVHADQRDRVVSIGDDRVGPNPAMLRFGGLAVNWR